MGNKSYELAFVQTLTFNWSVCFSLIIKYKDPSLYYLTFPDQSGTNILGGQWDFQELGEPENVIYSSLTKSIN